MMYCVIWEDRIDTVVHGNFVDRNDAEIYMVNWAADIFDTTVEEVYEEYGLGDITDCDNHFTVAHYVMRGDK